ncbi:hypothetical protein BJ875DRAFT_13535 [Amylocarpus encephaloides]|uniref:Major facilitator superfamily (MFS) profile domain-containing protein n=1 Tax=Amylocarpus encephaloides TaxID=45428 RepID=A0A9P7YT27_9HELO|nr:hypothetical protein BJ875DRAFT_13535 [Amylocarpus encephaloides]
MLRAPMSGIPQIGRNPVYSGTLIIIVLFQFAVLNAKNLEVLLAFRVLTGHFGSPVLSTTSDTPGEIFAPGKRDYASVIWGISAAGCPVLGPLISAFATQYQGWRWPIWELHGSPALLLSSWFSSFTPMESRNRNSPKTERSSLRTPASTLRRRVLYPHLPRLVWLRLTTFRPPDRLHHRRIVLLHRCLPLLQLRT